MTNNHALITKLQFLKLGGSLITDKKTPRTSRQGVIMRLAEEIKTAKEETADLKLVLGHGSGSFGHVSAKQYGTRQGVHSPEGWRGFAEVWYEAGLLNHLIMEVLHNVGLSAVAFPPSAGMVAQNGKPLTWEISGLAAALDNELLPVVFGDVIFDQIRGGTIFSTEDVFSFLAKQLHPERILLAGIDAGVWADFPDCTQLISEITPDSWPQVEPSLRGSVATDVTGGMASKVQGMLDLVEEIPGLEVLIFSGDQPGNVATALRGETLGTRLTNNR
jgi:isopentenyl phosphate kinase